MKIRKHLKFGDGNEPNLCRVKKLEVSSTKYISVWVDPCQFLRLFLSLRLKTQFIFRGVNKDSVGGGKYFELGARSAPNFFLPPLEKYHDVYQIIGFNWG